MTDLDRSVAFYCDLLGAVMVRPPFPGTSPSFSGRMAILMLGGTAMDLYEHAGNEGERFRPARTGLDHLALVAHSRHELELWAGWIDAHRVPRSEMRDDPTGAVRLFDFVDPDGIQIEICFVHER